MDPQVQGSFIPKQPLTGGTSHGGTFSLFFLIAMLIFVASIVAAGGAFAYEQYLGQSITGKQSELAKYEKAYDLENIQLLSRFDKRINNAKALLIKHIAPSSLFSYLGTQTLEKVQFTGFDFSLTQDGSASVVLAGVADTFATVALQSDQFGASRVLRDVVFSGVTLGGDGRVSFAVTFNVDPAVLLYSKSLETGAVVPQLEPQS